MSPNPIGFLEHLKEKGYHPRSNKHSNALSQCIVDDLLKNCSAIRQKAAQGRLVYDLNFTLRSRTSDWNVDLVLGEPPLEFTPTPQTVGIPKYTPSTIQVAIEIKSVMTEHNKAIRNRKRDFEAHQGHVHEYSRSVIAGGVLVVNGSPTFKSPLRNAITNHKDPGSLIKLCMDQMRAVTQRTNINEVGLDAKALIVVGMDNINNRCASFITKAPAPLVGDPMHYDAFIQAICHLYTDRFQD